MNAVIQRNPELAAGVLAFSVHVFFLILLVVGVSWQIENPAPVMVDLWSALPAKPEPQSIEPPPRPQHAPQAAMPKPVEEPPLKAPDIALEKKKKAEEERRRKEEERQLEQAALREEAQLRAEQKKRELAEKKRHDALEHEEAELQKRLMNEAMSSDVSQLKAMQAKVAADRRSVELGRVVADFRDRIRAKIRGNTRIPDGLAGNPEVKFKVNVLPTGEVVGVARTRSSGNAAYDQAVERAIYKSAPLPLPADKDAIAQFRELDLKFRPQEN